jgi:aarF domain-containing kinase
MSLLPFLSKRVRRTVGLTSLGGTGAYVLYKYRTDEGSRRAFQAYASFVPVILHYRWLEARKIYLGDNITDDDWKALDEKYAVPTVAKLGDLQGMYCKYGQTAAGFTNTLGEKWIHELRKLEDKVPPRSFECIRETIENETGKKLEDIFHEIDPVPLGSASIGQVHRAVLKQQQQSIAAAAAAAGTRNNATSTIDGHVVAVKVQYPEAQQLFQGDMRTIRSMCEILAPEQIVMLQALEDQNASELDYNQESCNLQTIRDNMKRHGFMPSQVVVPKPIQILTSSTRVLVMELVPGQKLIDGIHEYYRIWAKQHGTTLEQLERDAIQRIEREGIPSKYDGPSANQLVWYQRYLRAKDSITNCGISLYNGTIGCIIPSSSSPSMIQYRHTILPPNTPRIIDTLMRVHGYQLFVDGFFNAGE